MNGMTKTKHMMHINCTFREKHLQMTGNKMSKGLVNYLLQDEEY